MMFIINEFGELRPKKINRVKFKNLLIKFFKPLDVLGVNGGGLHHPFHHQI